MLCGVSSTAVNKLQKVQNRAAWLISGTTKREHINPTLRKLHWLPIESRIKFKVLVLTYKALHDLSPEYLKQMLSIYEPSRKLRSSDRNLLSVPKFKTATYSRRCFRSIAPTLWNQLPDSIRKAQILSSFKSNLKTHLFKEHFNCWSFIVVLPFCLLFAFSFIVKCLEHFCGKALYKSV